MFNARFIRITPYEVTIDKKAGNLDSLKIALVADLHLGYSVGTSRVNQMVDKINAQNPGSGCHCEDIFDNEYEALDKPEKLAEILSGLEITTAPMPATETTIFRSRFWPDLPFLRMVKK